MKHFSSQKKRSSWSQNSQVAQEDGVHNAARDLNQPIGLLS